MVSTYPCRKRKADRNAGGGRAGVGKAPKRSFVPSQKRKVDENAGEGSAGNAAKKSKFQNE